MTQSDDRGPAEFQIFGFESDNKLILEFRSRHGDVAIAVGFEALHCSQPDFVRLAEVAHNFSEQHAIPVGQTFRQNDPFGHGTGVHDLDEPCLERVSPFEMCDCPECLRPHRFVFVLKQTGNSLQNADTPVSVAECDFGDLGSVLLCRTWLVGE